MTDQFVHLHNHTDNSLLDGAGKVAGYANQAAELKQPAIAMTDHGNMHGAYDFAKACEAAGVKPIIGLETYLMPGTWPRTHKERVLYAQGGEDDISGRGAYTHMTLLATNTEAMHRLFKINTHSWYDGFYNKPRADRELLSQHAKGLIGTTGCPSGEVQTLIRLGRYDQACQTASDLRDIFDPGHFFVELMDHGIGIEKRAREDLLRLAKDLNIPLLATNDCHYVHKGEHELHDTLLCVSSGSNLSDPDRFKFDAQDFYLKSAEEMRKLWANHPEACDNTLLVAEMCEPPVFESKNLMPRYHTPEGHTEQSWFEKEVWAGLERRYPEGVPQDRIERANYEIGVIRDKGYPGYFLVVADFINWAKENGIRVGPGRGCLTGDVPVITQRGNVSLKDVKIGDTVRTHTGAEEKVTATHRYECDEELVSIRAYYDDSTGVRLTSDHKVWAQKGEAVTNRKKIAQGYRWVPPTGADLMWVQAGELEIGDMVTIPRPQGPWKPAPVLDLAEYADENCKITDTEIIEYHRINFPYPYSVRQVSEATGISRPSLSSFVNTLEWKRDRNFSDPSLRAQKTKSEKVMEFVGEAFNSTEEWAAHVRAHRFVETRVPRFVAADENFSRLFGMLCSDGWIRKSDPAEVGLVVRRSEDDNSAPEAFHKVWGLESTVAKEPGRDITQYRIKSRAARRLYAKMWDGYEFSSSTKSIPEWMLNLPEENRRALLEGLWWGDGSHSGKSSYATTSPRLKEAVRYLLWSLGLPAGCREENRIETREGWGTAKPSWIITTTPRFGPMKNQHGWADEKYIYQRIYKIDAAPAEPVYDITVDGDHSYTTSSFAVHNSGAGSLVAYAMDITTLDPIVHGLLFERFLNPERPSMPDFDVDFDENKREQVIRYVIDKYGSERVAQIVTFGKFKTKAAIKDAARVHGYPFAMGEKITKALPPAIMGKDATFVDVFDPAAKRHNECGDVRRLYETDPDVKAIMDAAKPLLGFTRGTGVHAAGVIMSAEPIEDIIPLFKRPADGAIITQFEYPICEDLGMVKMDFLGLANLSTLDECLTNIKANKGEDIVLEELDSHLSDPATFNLLAKGDTLGVFQLDSSPIRALLRSMNPTEFNDISAVLALYRPGPMGVNAHNDYADRKNNRKPVSYIHPELSEALKPILDETYGLIVYQEQVMEIAQKLAGYTLGQADLLRRAMGKKKKEVLDKEFVPFSDGMKASGFSEAAITVLWETLVPFSDYAFNKCMHVHDNVRGGDGNAIRLADLHKQWVDPDRTEDIYLMSMWSDGTVKPHKVKNVVRTGRKRLFEVTTASGATTRITEDHRMLTTRGYLPLSEISVGDELIHYPKETTEKQRQARRANANRVLVPWTRTEEGRAVLSERQRKVQAGRLEILRQHMKDMHKKYPNMTVNSLAAMKERVAWLRANDPEWVRMHAENSFAAVRATYDTGPGYGHCSIASNGMWCASRPERNMCEWLIEQGIDFEMHKVLPNGRMCDFYFDGTYWEMDGMDRTFEFFQKKYGDLPFVVVTPEDYKQVVTKHLGGEHVENGDPIVSIEFWREAQTCDVEMAEDGPKNFLTSSGLVSHNSHSAAYGVISFYTAYLKANYPVEYMAALLTTNSGDLDKTRLYLAECHRMGIEVLSPDVNESVGTYTAVGDSIRVGLDAIKNVGRGVVAGVVQGRTAGPYTDLGDFLTRVEAGVMKKNALESMIKAGCFDSLDHKRRALHLIFADALDMTSAARKHEAIGQDSLFGEEDETVAVTVPDHVAEWPKKMLLAHEKEMLGLYVSDHPLSDITDIVRAKSDTSVGQILAKQVRPGILNLAGVITGVERKTTKTGDPWMKFTLEDTDGAVEILAFSKAYQDNHAVLQADEFVVVKTRYDLMEDGTAKLMVQSAKTLDTSMGAVPDPVYVKVSEKDLTPPVIARFKETLNENPGRYPLRMVVEKPDGTATVWALSSEYLIQPGPELGAALKAILGLNCLDVQQPGQ